MAKKEKRIVYGTDKFGMEEFDKIFKEIIEENSELKKHFESWDRLVWIAEQDGGVYKYDGGDGLILFMSPNGATECMVEFDKAMRKKAKEYGENKRK